MPTTTSTAPPHIKNMTAEVANMKTHGGDFEKRRK
jgi:hypothetical protein